MSTKGTELTAKQKLIVQFMREFLAENDNMPTHKEVSIVFGFNSTNASFEHFKALERHKIIERTQWPSIKWRFVRSVTNG